MRRGIEDWRLPIRDGLTAKDAEKGTVSRHYATGDFNFNVP